MNGWAALQDNRTALTGAAAALLIAVSATVIFIFPEVPPGLVSLWSAAAMALVRLGEVFYDHRSGGASQEET